MKCNAYEEQSKTEGGYNTGQEIEIVLANSYDNGYQTNMPQEPSPRHEHITQYLVHNNHPRYYPNFTYPVTIQINWYSEIRAYMSLHPNSPKQTKLPSPSPPYHHLAKTLLTLLINTFPISNIIACNPTTPIITHETEPTIPYTSDDSTLNPSNKPQNLTTNPYPHTKANNFGKYPPTEPSPARTQTPTQTGLSSGL